MKRGGGVRGVEGVGAISKAGQSWKMSRNERERESTILLGLENFRLVSQVEKSNRNHYTKMSIMESNMQKMWIYIYIYISYLHWPYDLVSNNAWVVRCDDWVVIHPLGWVVTHPLGCDHVSGNQHKTFN